jgi:hypothetical protein
MSKHAYPFSLPLLAGLAACCPGQAAPASPQASGGHAQSERRIAVRPGMIVNESASGDAFQLFDEPAAVDGGGAPKTFWNAGYNKVYYPLTAFVDLGAVTHVTNIAVYDGEGTGDFRVEYGTPFHWQPLVSDPLTSYLSWNRHPVDIRTRYLRFVIPDPGTRVPEVALYGEPATPDRADAPPPSHPHVLPTMDQFIGTNAFIDDPLDKMAVVGFVREYHSWSWDAGDGKPDTPPFPNNRLALNPSYAAGGNAWFFDDYYAGLKAAGVSVCPAIQGNVLWLAGDPGRMNWKVCAPGQDPANPASYAAHADEMFQYAARYGSAHVPDSLLKLMPNQPRKSGLGLLHYFENQNEADAWWAGRDAYASPYEFAAQCSADYDGNKKSMGATFGVKNADPKAKMVIGGLANPTLDYIKAMKVWADWNRGGDFPADVLNLHHYSNSAGVQGFSISISPEDDRLKERFQDIIDYRNRYLPGKEIWVTEFGYDTNPASPMRAPAIGKTSSEETQARWIIRSYLALAAAGIDRAAQYMLRDVDPSNPGQFASCGLVTQKGEWKPKLSWYYTATLKTRLTGMRYAGEAPSGDPRVRIYRFRSDRGNGAYVVWSATSENASVPNFRLSHLGPARSATLVEMAGGRKDGSATPLAVTDGGVTVTVSECPVIVLVDAMAK